MKHIISFNILCDLFGELLDCLHSDIQMVEYVGFGSVV